MDLVASVILSNLKAKSFIGTQQKYKVYEKTVYPVEQLSDDGVVYHKSCFKCSHCKGTLKLSNYSSMEGVLYCKPHFEQLFKESGNINKNFQSPARLVEKSTPELTRSPSKAASMLSGTQKNVLLVVKQCVHWRR
ncbi:LIM domain-containing protein WLIM2b [Citrus sinensis]|nr:LIM domain-containing protein WLIM2b [Citrus sinensis]